MNARNVRTRACLLLSLAVLFSLFTGFAPQSTAETMPTAFPFSADPAAAFRLTIDGDLLRVENLPADPSFDYLLLRLRKTGGEAVEAWEKRGKDNGASLSVAALPDGRYYFDLYTSSEEFGSYHSYIFQEMMPIQLTKGSAAFLLSPVYESNMSIFNTKRRDKESLAYYRLPSHGIESDDARITALSKDITKNSTDDYQRLKAVHDWVSANIWYDYDVLYQKSPYGNPTALSTYLSGRGVCQGYAYLTAALLRAAGIPAKVVSGYALGVTSAGTWTESVMREEGNHAWNEAYVNGRWVILDATWDSGNAFENGMKTTNDGLLGHLYFDISPELFSADHRIDDYDESKLPPAAAAPTVSAVTVNGQALSFDAYNIADNNYFKLRDLAYVLNGTSKQFEVSWDNDANTIRLESGAPYTVVGAEMQGKGAGVKDARFTSSRVLLDGKELRLTAYNIEGNNYVKLRDVGKALGFQTAWDAQSNTVRIDTSKPYTDQ